MCEGKKPKAGELYLFLATDDAKQGNLKNILKFIMHIYDIYCHVMFGKMTGDVISIAG